MTLQSTKEDSDWCLLNRLCYLSNWNCFRLVSVRRISKVPDTDFSCLSFQSVCSSFLPGRQTWKQQAAHCTCKTDSVVLILVSHLGSFVSREVPAAPQCSPRRDTFAGYCYKETHLPSFLGVCQAPVFVWQECKDGANAQSRMLFPHNSGHNAVFFLTIASKRIHEELCSVGLYSIAFGLFLRSWTTSKKETRVKLCKNKITSSREAWQAWTKHSKKHFFALQLNWAVQRASEVTLALQAVVCRRFILGIRFPQPGLSAEPGASITAGRHRDGRIKWP